MKIQRKIIRFLKFFLSSLLIGGIVGSLTAIFGRGLLLIQDFRQSYFYFLVPFLAIVGGAFTFIYQRYGAEARAGMTLVFQVGQGETNMIPKRLIPFITIGTWLAHLFGASVGREGVAVQIGATVASQFRSWLEDAEDHRLLIVVGMASGFAGLFGTPFAATFFALEVLVVGQLQLAALPYALVASVVSTMTAQSLELEKFTVDVPALTVHLEEVWKFILLGILFGIVGRLFSVSLHGMKKQVNRIFPDPVKRIVVMAIGISVLLILLENGRYAGLGTNLIQASLNGGEIVAYDWIIKLSLTVLSLAAGFQGGEVTPLFAIGASLGSFVAPFIGIDSTLVAAIGYVCVFGSATNTVLAPMLIAGEVFGFANFPYFAVACIFAFAVNGNRTIYMQQKLAK